jgi:hypothetical protein
MYPSVADYKWPWIRLHFARIICIHNLVCLAPAICGESVAEEVLDDRFGRHEPAAVTSVTDAHMHGLQQQQLCLLHIHTLMHMHVCVRIFMHMPASNKSTWCVAICMRKNTQLLIVSVQQVRITL